MGHYTRSLFLFNNGTFFNVYFNCATQTLFQNNAINMKFWKMDATKIAIISNNSDFFQNWSKISYNKLKWEINETFLYLTFTMFTANFTLLWRDLIIALTCYQLTSTRNVNYSNDGGKITFWKQSGCKYMCR